MGIESTNLINNHGCGRWRENYLQEVEESTDRDRTEIQIKTAIVGCWRLENLIHRIGGGVRDQPTLGLIWVIGAS